MPLPDSLCADPLAHDSAPEELARQWLHGIRMMHVAHGIAGERRARLARGSGVLVAVLTAVVGSVLLTSSTAAESSVRAAGVLSILASALALGQVAFNYPELAFRHHEAFVGYGALRRRVETALVSGGYGGVTRNQLEELREDWREVEATAPAIPFLVRRRARRSVSVPPPRTEPQLTSG